MALLDNLTTQVNLAWDPSEINAVSSEIEGFDPSDYGFDFMSLEDIQAKEQEKQKKKQEREIRQLKDDFIMPPMSVLDTTKGLWQQRRNFWLEKTQIRSFVGRDENITFSVTAQGSSFYEMKNDLRAKLQREPTTEEVVKAINDAGIWMFAGTSVFDPVLCELMYRWYNVKGGKILDPFAGGSVRGVMAGQFMMEYHGNDLSERQVTENRAQAAEAFPEDWQGPLPRWTIGDSQYIDDILEADGFGDTEFDLVFSCPPYADLEVYSKDPSDLSNMPYDKFLRIYREVIRKACAKLKENRFAVFVVGEVRGKDGEYYDFVGDTVQAFKDAGLKYYNELILLNQIGSTSMRVRGQFSERRKNGKHHQNILVFAKGQPDEVNDMYERINVRKSIEQFNEQRRISDQHNKVLVFFKGDHRNIHLDFESTTPPDPKWEDITICTEKPSD
jgi:DNA modification methylase